MSKSYRDGLPISPDKFVDQLMRLKRGSISRRDFLGLTGLGVATAVMARELGIMPTPAFAAENLGDRMSIATWPNYHDPQTFENFKDRCGYRHLVIADLTVTALHSRGWDSPELIVAELELAPSAVGGLV